MSVNTEGRKGNGHHTLMLGAPASADQRNSQKTHVGDTIPPHQINIFDKLHVLTATCSIYKNCPAAEQAGIYLFAGMGSQQSNNHTECENCWTPQE
jgi:hypothetical protein